MRWSCHQELGAAQGDRQSNHPIPRTVGLSGDDHAPNPGFQNMGNIVNDGIPLSLSVKFSVLNTGSNTLGNEVSLLFYFKRVAFSLWLNLVR